MATIFEGLKARWNNFWKARATQAAQSNPVDTNIPFGLRIGGKVSIKHFLPPSLAKTFPSGSQTVEEFSTFELSGKKGWLVFLVSDKGQDPSYLWIQKDDKGQLIRWFKNFDEAETDQEEDWDRWLSDEDGLLGRPTFQEEANGPVYARVWNAGYDKRIPPVKWSEMRFPDKYDGAKAFSIDNASMLYSTVVADATAAGDTEYVLVTHEEVLPHNGNPASVGIQIDHGVDLEESHLTVY